MKKIPGLLLAIDFEKAFDNVELESIDKTLKTFNFEGIFKNTQKCSVMTLRVQI